MIENANISLHALNDITDNSAPSKGAVLQGEEFEAFLTQMAPVKKSEAGRPELLNAVRGLECIGAEAAQEQPCFEGGAEQASLSIEQGVDSGDLGICAAKDIIEVGVEVTAKDSESETLLLVEDAKRIASDSKTGAVTGEPVEEACVIVQEMLYGAVRARLRSIEAEIESDSEKVAAASNATALVSEIAASRSEGSEDVRLPLQRDSNADLLERGQNSVKHDLLQGLPSDFIKPVQVEVSTAILKYEETQNMQSVHEQIVAKIAISRSQKVSGTHKIFLHLEPRNLGSIEIVCSFGLDGRLQSVDVLAESSLTHQALRSGQGQLSSMLANFAQSRVDLSFRTKTLDDSIRKVHELKERASKSGAKYVDDGIAIPLRSVIIDLSGAGIDVLV